MLSGKYRGQEKPDLKSRIGIQAAVALPRYWFDDALRMIDVTVEAASRLGKTPSQVALSWLFGDPRITAAIIGARSADQVAENLDAGDYDLPAAVQDELTATMPLKLGYPYEWTSVTFPGTFGGRAERTPTNLQQLP
jgi:aryl-alcohol dehydrogenase-like predicted oxidoreductase